MTVVELRKAPASRGLVPLASILLLALVCSRTLQANEHFYVPPEELEDDAAARKSDKIPQRLVLSRLTPARGDHNERQAIRSAEQLAPMSGIGAQWADLQSRIQSEEKTLAACRTDPVNCSAAARKFLEIVELGRQRQGRARLGEINRAVNLSIRPASDWAQHGVADFWSAPLATLNAQAGDCEDYAVVKYVALREAGIALEDLRLLMVHYPRRGTNHVVVAVHLGEEWLILDNRTMILVNSDDARHYRPLFALNHRGVNVLYHSGMGDGFPALIR